jgi:UDP-glucuronate 4-epimerase
MKTLITGCAGFIGFHLSLMLLKKNKFVIGIDNLNSYYDIKIKKKRLNLLKKYKNFFFIKFDLSKKKNFEKINKFKKDIDIILHLAGQAGVRYSIKNPWTYLINNQYAYINLLEYFKNSKTLKIILYASSSSVFGNAENKETIEKPLSVYAETKHSMENLSYIYSRFYNLKLVGMRFFTVYGPFGRPDMSIYKFTKGIISQKKIDVFNFGDHERSFTYIDDLVNNINQIIIKLKNLNYSFSKVVSIGNPQSVKLMKVIRLIEKFCQKKSIIKFFPMQPGDVKYTKANIAKEVKFFSFRFETNIEQGIYNFVNWYKNEKF